MVSPSAYQEGDNAFDFLPKEKLFKLRQIINKNLFLNYFDFLVIENSRPLPERIQQPNHSTYEASALSGCNSTRLQNCQDH